MLGNVQKQNKSDKIMFSSSDDNAVMNQVQASHAPDGREIDAKSILIIVEDILTHATPSVESIATPATQTDTEVVDNKTHQGGIPSTMEAVAYVIDRIACEIECKCLGGGEAHGTTMSILGMLSCYSWDAKLAIALASFAMNYGEFWLVVQNCSSNQLAKSVAILKQLPDMLEQTSMFKPRFDAVKGLTTVMLDISKCIVDFKQLPSQYITADVTSLQTAVTHIPIAVYWTIRCMVACASQINGLVGFGHQQFVSTTEAWELSNLACNLRNMYSHLAAQLAICYKHIDERKLLEAFQNLLHLFEMIHIDNTRVLKALICGKGDLLPLVDGATKQRVNVDVLRKKNVLLLISDLGISQEEVSILEQIYSESQLHPMRQEAQYELVWLAVVDPAAPWKESQQAQFEKLRDSMPWYTVHHPSLIDRAVLKFMKEVWHLDGRPILVVLDPQGRVVCPNALHMMWIWGSTAFPFTSSKEESLWKEESWRLELLVDEIDPLILTWISEERYVCLYGGLDMDWIRKFTAAATAVAEEAGILMGMVYVGKSNPKERVRKNKAAIAAEKLSHQIQEMTSIWYFWIRIESMWCSRTQLGKTMEDDPMMQEIMKLLSFDGNDGGWALIGRGGDLARDGGTPFLTCLQNYDLWKENVEQKGFLPALRDQLDNLRSDHHCSSLVFTGTSGVKSDRILCVECSRPMQRFVLYKCCDA